MPHPWTALVAAARPDDLDPIEREFLPALTDHLTGRMAMANRRAAARVRQHGVQVADGWEVPGAIVDADLWSIVVDDDTRDLVADMIVSAATGGPDLAVAHPSLIAGPPEHVVDDLIADRVEALVALAALVDDSYRRQLRAHTLVASAAQFANPWHDEIGRFAPKGSGSSGGGAWAPTMSRADAEAWSAGSAITADQYHGTTHEKADQIRESGFDPVATPRVQYSPLGVGTFLSPNPSQSSGYFERLEGGGELLTVKVNVHRVATLEDAVAAGGLVSARGPVPKEDYGRRVTEQLQSQGFDAINYAGLGELVVFDPTNIVVVSDAVVAAAGDLVPVTQRQVLYQLGVSGPLSAQAAQFAAAHELLASTRAAELAAMLSGGSLFKRWRTRQDERVRTSHAAADGQTVPARGDFTIGGFPAQHPGDRRLPIGETANCRCVLEQVTAGGRVDARQLGSATKRDLAKLATELGIPGRSKMSKDQLFAAVDRWRHGFGDQRIDTMTRMQLLQRARLADVRGRWRMRKPELVARLAPIAEGRDVARWRQDHGYVPVAQQRLQRRVIRDQMAVGHPWTFATARPAREQVFIAHGGRDLDRVGCVACGAELHWTDDPTVNRWGAEVMSLVTVGAGAQGRAPFCRCCAAAIAENPTIVGSFATRHPWALVASAATVTVEEQADLVLAGEPVTVHAQDLADLVALLTTDCDLTLVTISEDPDGLFSSVADTGVRDRDQMPVVNLEHVDAFLTHLRSCGYGADLVRKLPGELRATQRELNGRKVAEFIVDDRLGDDDHPLWCSAEGFLLDGHHRWAANVVLAATDPDIDVPVMWCSATIDELLACADEFNEDEGIESKTITASARAQFANPWHDEQGKFAPKGSGVTPAGDEMVTVSGLMGPMQVPAKFVSESPDFPGEHVVDYTGWKAETDAKSEAVRATVRDAQAPMTGEQAQSMGVYQSAFGVHQQINGELRAGEVKDPIMQRHVKHIDAVIAGSQLPTDTTLHRGIQFGNVKEQRAFMAQLTPGATLLDRGYMSTSLDPTIGEQFAGFGSRPAVTMKIRAPAGTGFRYLGDKESEVLLGRGTSLRVVSVKPGVSVSKWDVFEVEMEVVA